jgi:DNA-binding CsgD family transcriptional regulator
MNPIAVVQPLTPPGPEPDDFMQQMRHAAGLTCVVGGLFRPGGAGLDALRMAAAPGISRDVANDLVRSATARVAVHVRLNDGQGSLRQRPATTKPVWFGEAGVLIGVGAPDLGRWPVLACQFPASRRRAEIEPLLGLGLAYLAQIRPGAADLAPVNPEQAAQATLRMLSIGCIILDAQGRVVHDGCGEEAKRSGPLRVLHGKLSLPREEDRTALRRAVADAVSDRQRLSIVPLANDAGQVSLVAVTPLRQPGGARMALVLFDTRQTDHGALQLHFFKAHALTRSESLIACEVLNGKTPTEMAQSTGLSLATVRSYLKQIMAKTGTHRQSELVALYYSCIIPVAPAFAADAALSQPSA